MTELKSDNEIIMETMKTQIEAVKDFTQELIQVHNALNSVGDGIVSSGEKTNKELKEVNNKLAEILGVFTNGLKDEIKTKVREENNILYYKLGGTLSLIMVIVVGVAKLIGVM